MSVDSLELLGDRRAGEQLLVHHVGTKSAMAEATRGIPGDSDYPLTNRLLSMGFLFLKRMMNFSQLHKLNHSESLLSAAGR